VWHEMFTEQIPIIEKILRTVLVYALITVLFRITGKRGLANLNTFDFVVIFLLSNVVQNAVIGPDQSLLGGVIGAVTLLATNSLVNRVVAVSDRAARILEGSDTVVIREGQVVKDAVGRLGLRRNELEQAVRLQDADDIGQVELGTLDPSGQLLLTLKASEQGATKGDIARLTEQLARIEELLAAPR
jgi:uncharacterized membrane protein YcaP (DUF421 family)